MLAKGVDAAAAVGKYGVEKIGDLTSKSANVATFDDASKMAAQTFYLAEAGGTVVSTVSVFCTLSIML